MELAHKQYGPTFLPDQKSPEAQRKFLTELQAAVEGVITNDKVMRFSLKYGFGLENAFKAIQMGIDNDLVDADRFDDNVLYITHRQEFLKGMPTSEVASFNQMVTQEIERLSGAYQENMPEKSDIPAQPNLIQKPVSETQSGVARRIRHRMRP